MKKTITVMAGAGRVMHFPKRVIAAPGATTMIISGDQTAQVDEADRFVIKRIQCGDLVVVKATRAQATPAPSKSKKLKTEDPGQ